MNPNAVMNALAPNVCKKNMEVGNVCYFSFSFSYLTYEGAFEQTGNEVNGNKNKAYKRSITRGYDKQ